MSDAHILTMLKTISETKTIANEMERRIIFNNIELFALSMMNCTNTEQQKQFYHNTSLMLIHENAHLLNSGAFLHACMATFTNVRTDTTIFAFLLHSYLTDDAKYDDFAKIKVHNEEHYNIVTSSKRIQKCLMIIHRLCKSKPIDSKMYRDIIQNVCLFGGNIDSDSLIKDAFFAIHEELEHLKQYKFFVALGDSKVHEIYAFIIDELLDCGDELEQYVEELACFINLTGEDNYVRVLEHYHISNTNTWSHRQLKSLHT